MLFQKFLSVLCLLALLGCASPGPSARVTLSDGRKLIINVRDGRVVGEENKQVIVQTARYMYNIQKKEGRYIFGLVFSNGSVPDSIKIEDISGSKAVVMVQDQKPVLKERVWQAAGPVIGLDDPSMEWMHVIDDSFRIYRLTVVFQGGAEVVFHHAALYPGFAKVNLISAFEHKVP